MATAVVKGLMEDSFASSGGAERYGSHGTDLFTGPANNAFTMAGLRFRLFLDGFHRAGFDAGPTGRTGIRDVPSNPWFSGGKGQDGAGGTDAAAPKPGREDGCSKK